MTPFFRKALPFGLAFALAASVALAQESSTPFDMSGERPADAVEKPAAETGTATDTGTAQPAAKATVAETGIRRYIVPSANFQLQGEVASQSFPVFLTAQQAEAATAINIGYSNAVVVAPEASQMTIIVNDVTIGSTPIRSPDGTSEMRLDIPPAVLRPGINRVTFNATHRHRTDCTIPSTYELWTTIDPSKTYFTVPPDTSGRLLTTDDIAATGVGPTGQTKFVIVVPEMGQPISTNATMRLSQGLALIAKMPNQTVEVVNQLPATSGAGELTILLGTAGDLAPILPGLPTTASTSAVATFVDSPAGDRKVLAVSGPSWPAIEGAVEGIISPIDRPHGVAREALSIRQRNAAEMPLITGATSLTLGSLGVRTEGEFTGRRYRTGFDVGVPSDFYADAYGEATLLLDAAYSPAVQPGSHLDVYVNGNIASTVPITSRNGGIFRHLPIRVTMRHFKPGPNRIDIEAILMTEADKVCAPGATAVNEPRFALFDSSEFRMPRFARIAELPNLAALSGTGFPYGRQTDPIALFLDRLDTETLSTGATFLGKMAVASGRALTVRPESSALAIGERNAILIGAISQLPPLVLAQTHIAGESASSWGSSADAGAQREATQDSFNQWQTRVSSGSWRGQISAVETWLHDTFDISLSSLRILPGSDEFVAPDDTSRFLIAQGDSPGRTATWTVLAAPTAADLSAGMMEVAREGNWEQLAGYMSLESNGVASLDTRAATQTRFEPTQPWSFVNMRLIAANWLSSNILAYAALFVFLSVILGLATSRLLSRFGRPG